LQPAQHWSAAQAHLIFCQVSIHPRQALLAQKARGHSSINNARLRLANDLKHTIIQHKETQKNILEKKNASWILVTKILWQRRVWISGGARKVGHSIRDCYMREIGNESTTIVEVFIS
jgi:hypothetical protein